MRCLADPPLSKKTAPACGASIAESLRRLWKNACKAPRRETVRAREVGHRVKTAEPEVEAVYQKAVHFAAMFPKIRRARKLFFPQFWAGNLSGK